MVEVGKTRRFADSGDRSQEWGKVKLKAHKPRPQRYLNTLLRRGLHKGLVVTGASRKCVIHLQRQDKSTGKLRTDLSGSLTQQWSKGNAK